MIIGTHVSFGNEQLLGCTKEELLYKGNTFMFYTGNPQNTLRKDIDENKLKEAFILMKENGINIDNVICHAPYIINLANKSKNWEFSINFLKNEIKRCKIMRVKYIVVHPGNAINMTKEEGLNNIIEAINIILKEEKQVTILLETMAGKGTECASNINEVKYLIDNIENKEHIGVCLDTCHLNDSGVDISKFDEYLDNFDKLIGINKIKCVHLNDSKNEINTHKDRHANIGYGTIGFESLYNVAHNEKIKDVPKILETPYINDIPPYKEEIESLKTGNFNYNLF